MEDTGKTLENNLEKDIQRLSQEIKTLRNLPEGQNLSDKELIQRALKSEIKQVDFSANKNVPVISEAESNKIEKEVLPNYLKDSPDDLKLEVERVVELTFRKGLWEAIAEAKKRGPVVVDALHDALTDKVYEEFKKRNLF